MARHIVLLSLAAMLAGGAATAHVVGTNVPAQPITAARVAALPIAQRAPWLAYLERSAAAAAADRAALAAERTPGMPIPPAPHAGHSGGGGMPLGRDAAWYGSAEARRVADNIVSFQTPAGGWSKNQDRDAPPRLRGQSYIADNESHYLAAGDFDTPRDSKWSYVGTLDNNATWTELRFLARVQAALPGHDGEVYRASFFKGIGYLIAAQFPNGGWPQVWPLEGGYHDALTYNDDAVAEVAMLLAELGDGRGDYAFAPADLRARARAAADRALDVILKTQVTIGGKRTIWAQQHDALTLAPAGARNFEPPALSTDESADLLLFLMRRPMPAPAVKAAVRDGVAWLKAHALYDFAWTGGKGDPSGRRLVRQTGAGPIWSRYYDLKTQAPIYGDRDKTIHDDVNELTLERRNGYSWLNTGPQKVIDRFAKWAAANP